MVAATLLLMTGLPLLTASVSGPLLPVFSVHAYLLTLWSSNRRWPTVFEPSRVTVVSAARDSVLKSAVLSAPVALMLFNQLAPFVQEPPANCVHTAVFKIDALNDKPVGCVSE